MFSDFAWSSGLSSAVLPWAEWVSGIGVWMFGAAFILASVGFIFRMLARGKNPDGSQSVTPSVFSTGSPVSRPKSFKK